MSSILRSSKFFKYLNSFNNKFVVSVKDFNVLPVLSSGVIKYDSRLFASAAVHHAPRENTIDKQIRKLDIDARRSGRISLNGLHAILEALKLSSQASSAQSLMIIRCCGNLIPQETSEVKLKLVNDVWNALVDQGVIMDISHYNALLMVYLENEHKFSPIEMLETLNKKGVEPNRVTFQRLIAAYCQQGNIEGATRILEFMKEKQMPISENIFNSLITGHSQAKDMVSAKGILSVMQQANIEPSSETYTALLCGYAMNEDLDGISEVFKLVDSKEISLNDRQLLDVIYSLGVNGHSKMIDIIIPRLSRQNGYNQDAKNTILRLIARGSDEAAIKVFKTMTPLLSSTDEPLPLGSFVIKQLVIMDRPYEVLKAYCDDLIKSKANERALHIATEASLVNGKTEVALKLLSALAEVETLCPHYYWPILCQYGKEKNLDAIIKTLKHMSMRLNTAVPNETLRDYVVEYVGADEKGIVTLRQAGITVASASCAVVAHHLINNNMALAAKIATKYKANYNIAPIKRSLVQALKATQDLDNFLLLVRTILSYSNGSSENSVEEGESNEEGKDFGDISGSILLDVANAVRKNRSETIADILKGYLEFGIGISASSAEALQDMLSGNDLTPEISSTLAKLTSSDLKFIPIQKAGLAQKIITFNKDESTLLKAIENAEAKEQPTHSFKIQLLMVYYRQQEYNKAAQIKQELADQKVDIPGDYLVNLLSLCISNENISEAESFYKEILSKQEKVSISDATLVKLATLYIQNDKFDEGLKIFETHKCDNFEQKEFSYSSYCWRLLNSVAESGDAEKLDKLFQTMVSCNFIVPNNVLLGPLVKVHLVNKDLKKALDKFEECCNLYRATPWKNELACQLIQNEDAASLQKLTDVSSKIHGEVNCLYDLVLSFLECGRIRQARRILETPGLRARHSRLTSACIRYQNEGHITHLENLVEVTKDLPHIDRSDLYYHLLGSYASNDEVDKALALWTQMQEEDVQPSDRFLIKLSNLLKKHKKPVPFSVPMSATSDRFYTLQKSSEETAQLKLFRSAIYKKDVDKAIQIKQSMLDTDLLSSDRSALLSLLINNGRIGESTKLLTRWLELGLRPNIKTLNYMINTIAKTGDIETLKAIGSLLDDDLKRMTSFSNRFTHCMVEAGKGAEVLQRLEREISEADTPEKIAECQAKFPRGGIFSLLLSSENVSRVEELANKYKEKGLMEPLNILWIHYFINRNEAKEAELWSTVKNRDRIMYQPILKKARAERDLKLATDLLSRCEEAKLEPGPLGAVHSCILDIYVLLGQTQECSNWLENSLKTIKIENLSVFTLKRMKTAFEREGMLFKYPISYKPRRSIMTSSSDSDSDDEVRQKV